MRFCISKDCLGVADDISTRTKQQANLIKSHKDPDEVLFLTLFMNEEINGQTD